MHVLTDELNFVMAIASKPRKFHECFNDVLANINWDLIKPSLEETKLLSQDEMTTAWCKTKNEKQRLRCIWRKITSDNRQLLVQAFKNTSHDPGHQKILEILQDVDSSGNIANSLKLASY